MAYEKINFVNDTTELSAENFNHMESGIENADKKVSVGASSNNSELWVSTSNNLFNKNNVEENKGISSSNGITYDTSGYTVSEYIYLKKGKYIGTGFNRYASYDTNKTFIKSELATSFELTADGYVRLQLQSANLDTTQLNEGTTLLPYQPYGFTGIQINNNGTYEKYTDTLSVGSKSNNAGLWAEVSDNLVKDINNTITSAGITFTNNGDGTITCNGTATSNTTFSMYLNTKKGTTYTLSGCPSNGSESSYKLIIVDAEEYTQTANEYGTGTTFTANYSKYELKIRIAKNYVCNNLVFKPMVNEGSTPSTFKSYGFQSIKANINGTYETIVNKNVYSTSEVVIGEWLGKPLYRKVIVQDTPTINAWTDIAHDISMDYGRIENANIFRSSDNSYIPITLESTTDYFTCNLKKTKFQYKIGGYSSITKLYAVLEYTKTTD